MENQLSLVTVIIPTYNNPKQLRRSVNSVLKQTYTDYEILIINDGSDVDYNNVRQLFEANKNILFFDKKNEGPGLARQLGLDNSNGKYIQYLDAGDELLPNKLESQVNILETNPNVIMTYGLSMINGDVNTLHRPKINRNIIDDLLKNVLEVRKWHTSSPLWYYSKAKYWSNLFNGEDVFHDFSVAISNKKNIYFDNNINVNLIFDNPDGGLSNASGLEKNHQRFVEDCLKLNLGMRLKLEAKGLLTKKKYANPLAERMFHGAMRVNLLGFKTESLQLVKASRTTTKSLIKQFELLILQLVINVPIENRRSVFQLIYKIRRKVLSPNIHQYRYI